MLAHDEDQIRSMVAALGIGKTEARWLRPGPRQRAREDRIACRRLNRDKRCALARGWACRQGRLLRDSCHLVQILTRIFLLGELEDGRSRA